MYVYKYVTKIYIYIYIYAFVVYVDSYYHYRYHDVRTLNRLCVVAKNIIQRRVLVTAGHVTRVQRGVVADTLQRFFRMFKGNGRDHCFSESDSLSPCATEDDGPRMNTRDHSSFIDDRSKYDK